MNIYKILAIVGLFSTGFAGPLIAASTDQVTVFRGVAKNERGEVVYTERHRLIYQDGRHLKNETRYLDPAGNEFAVLTSRFTSHPYVPNYRFVDKRFGRQDGAEVAGNLVRVYGQPSSGAARNEEMVTLKDNMITGQGLHFYIQDHLTELAALDQARKVEFLVPLQGEYFTFRIQRLDRAAPEPGTVAFKITIDNWFMRLFAPELEVEYDLASKRLLSYRGASNLWDEQKNVQNVTITYQYPDEQST